MVEKCVGVWGELRGDKGKVRGNVLGWGRR